MPTVYVSSTYKDLKRLRRRVIEAIRKVPQHVPINMEGYSADTRRPLDKCLRDVRDSDVYVGILGSRAGFVPDGETKSITRLEYEAAWQLGLPCLFFLQPRRDRLGGDDADCARAREFRELAEKRHTCKTIADETALGEDVMQGLFEQALRDPNLLEQKDPVPANSLLFFACDRLLQRQDFEIIFGDEKTAGTIPVCLVHGTAEQAPDRYLEWLCEGLLGELLRKPKLTQLELAWPLRSPDDDTFLKLLAIRLKDKASIDRTTAHAELFYELAKRPDDYFISTRLSIDHWQESESQRLLAFTDFFQAAARTHNPPKAVLVWVQYKSPEPQPWWHLTGRDRAEYRNGAVRSAFANLAKQRSAAKPIQELGNVLFDDIVDWPKRPEVMSLAGGRSLTEAMGQVFQGAEEGLHMRRLAKELARAVRISRQRTERP